MITLSWAILWTPFLTAVFIFFFLLSRPRAAGRLATCGMLAAFLCALALLWDYLSLKEARPVLESSILWIPFAPSPVEFGVLIDGLTILMLLIVTGIGSLIFLYSMSYMERDESCGRYFACLSLFAFSMLGIVLSNNFIQTFIFWELVGLSSYLLIGFWFEKREAATAGKKAFLTTRVGDVGMMIGILSLFGYLASRGIGTFNFLLIEERLQTISIPSPLLYAVCLGLFLGIAGKSAQAPLHVWLPDAMEGPTPVSALIHAATMVAAGVFLLARLFFLFAQSPAALLVIAWTGGITAVLAGTMAVVQNDIKKILAYSTLSQLGYMVLALGLGNPYAGMFHLTTHAFFKALLFLSAGSLIHALHTQNIWNMRTQKGLLRSMPITSVTFFIGTLALMGIPPTSGYFSKESILAAASHGSPVLFILALANVFFTSFYMGRLCTLVFFQKSHSARQNHLHTARESGWKMTIPLIILAGFSIGGGFLPLHPFLGARGHSEPHSNTLALISIALAGLGFLFAFLRYQKKSHEHETLDSWMTPRFILEKKYFFDDVYDAFIHFVQENIARVSDLFERRVVVEGGMNGSARLTRRLSRLVRTLQTGVVQFYALFFAAGVTVIIYVLILSGKS